MIGAVAAALLLTLVLGVILAPGEAIGVVLLMAARVCSSPGWHSWSGVADVLDDADRLDRRLAIEVLERLRQ